MVRLQSEQCVITDIKDIKLQSTGASRKNIWWCCKIIGWINDFRLIVAKGGVHSYSEDKTTTSNFSGSLSLFFCFFSALLEGQPAFGVVDEDLVHLVLREAPRQHLRHDVLKDVGVAVAAVLGEAVLGVDVVRDHDLVLVALLHEGRQAERRERRGGRERERKRRENFDWQV